MRPGCLRSPRSRSALLLVGLALSGGALVGCGGSSSDDESAKRLIELQQAREEGKKQAQDEARQKALAETAASLKDEVTRLKKGTTTKGSASRKTTTVVQRAASSGGGGGVKSCGSGITVNSVTSCTFAQAVRDAYYGSGQSSSISAYSAVTGQSYAMSCSSSGSTTCRGGNGAQVTFP